MTTEPRAVSDTWEQGDPYEQYIGQWSRRLALDADARSRLRELLRARLPAAADGSISLTARAWAARGAVSA
jgi:hypothetical protein